MSTALKLLDNTSATGLLPLTEEVMRELKEKYPKPATIKGDPFLRGPIQRIPEWFFDGTDEQLIPKVAKVTKGSGGPSGMDADQFRRFICSKNF